MNLRTTKTILPFTALPILWLKSHYIQSPGGIFVYYLLRSLMLYAPHPFTLKICFSTFLINKEISSKNYNIKDLPKLKQSSQQPLYQFSSTNQFLILSLILHDSLPQGICFNNCRTFWRFCIKYFCIRYFCTKYFLIPTSKRK